ncbi:MAG: flagellar biosynthesis protein FliQ [Proteobacteria bacterium]|nr:flagellar biosynthesis protein FliQ [Pseudomonadota bacterium]
MNESDIVDIAREAILVMLKVGGPILLIGLFIGIAVSLVQTVTQIQEATLAFVPKLIVVMLALLVTLPFMLSTLATFTTHLTDRIAAIGAPPQTHGP